MKIHEKIFDCLATYSITADPEQYHIGEIEVTFVDSPEPRLRGFSGVNKVYVNIYHFQAKLSICRTKTPLLQKLVKIDIANLVIHEISHVILRMVT